MADNKDKKVLNVPHLRFPEFSGEWVETTLGKISEITKGSGISKDQLSEQGSPCILYGELYTKYKSEIIDEVYSRTELDSSSLVKSKANDVIIPCSGETAIDISTARCVPFDNILLGGDLNIIRLKHDDGGFFAYQLNGARKKDIARVAQGVSVVHLYGENLKQIRVYHPNIEEQKKITRLLSLIDERIATQNKIIEKLETLIKGIVETVISSQKPNTLIKNCLECNSSTLQESQVAETGTFPVYGATDISGYTETAGINGESILIIKDGSGVGTVKFVSGEYSYIGTLNSLTAKDGYCLKYIYFALQRFSFEPYKTGMAIPHIYFKDYGKAKIYCPSFSLQTLIAQKLSLIENKMEVEKRIILCYQLQRSYLLSRMFI
ncbi:restriction endonuclease subunit S [Bacteroides xylanisolvens]|uniref:restriction endonuclease subunit S n=1 Tax=Bacteroides xylanisolvens TaxID=371601 RepID=UPI00189E9EF2|nr:restriction endonuclease subunit S [Bacteroides xylanisolvens]